MVLVRLLRHNATTQLGVVLYRGQQYVVELRYLQHSHDDVYKVNSVYLR